VESGLHWRRRTSLSEPVAPTPSYSAARQGPTSLLMGWASPIRTRVKGPMGRWAHWWRDQSNTWVTACMATWVVACPFSPMNRFRSITSRDPCLFVEFTAYAEHLLNFFLSEHLLKFCGEAYGAAGRECRFGFSPLTLNHPVQ
jgi:hypothetical protein